MRRRLFAGAGGALLFALSLAYFTSGQDKLAGGARCEDRSQRCMAQLAAARASSIEEVLTPGSVQVAPLPCVAARQLGFFATQPPLLPPDYACLNGDGSQDSTPGMTLSAVGSPSTQTMETSPNGSNNRAVSRQVITANNYFATPSIASPSASWSVAWVGSISAPLPASAVMMAQDDQGSNRAWYMRETTGNIQFNTYNGTAMTALAPANTLVGGVDHVVVMTYGYVGPGNVNRVTGYVDGVQVGQSTTAPAIPVVSTPIALGTHGGTSGAEPVSTIRGALFTSKELSALDVQRLQAALVPVPQTATGALISNSRNSASWVTTSGGALVALPPGRTGVVGPPGETGVVGGVVSAPSRTNLLTWSEVFGSGTTPQGGWVAAGTVTLSKGDIACGAAPDGSGNAYLLTCTSGPCGLTQGSGGSTVQTASLWLKAPSTGSVATGINVGTSVTGSVATAVNPGASWARASGSNGNTTGQAFALGYIGTWGTGKSVCAFGAQEETGSLASPYCRSEGTSATCAGDVITIPTPSWLSTKEGCAAISITPTWTGAPPILSGSVYFLNANASNTARLAYAFGDGNFSAYNGTNVAGVAAGFTSGGRKRYLIQWSASGNFLRVTNQSSGASGSAAFAGFPSFDTALAMGNTGGGAQPLGSIIDSITLGSTPGGCQ